jgi:hypothetical protein
MGTRNILNIVDESLARPYHGQLDCLLFREAKLKESPTILAHCKYPLTLDSLELRQQNLAVRFVT